MADSTEAGMVELVNPADGKTYRFGKQYEAEYRAKHWTDPTPAPTGVGSPEQQANTARIAAQSGAAPGPHYLRDMATETIPSIMAGAANLLVPGEGMIPAMLRLLTSFGGGTVGDLGAQKIRGEQLNFPRAALRGGLETVAQIPGEGLGAIQGAVRDAPIRLAEEALAAPTSVRRVSRGAPDTYLREGVPIGRPGSTTGGDVIESRIAASHAEEQATVDALESRLRSAPARELGKGVSPTLPQVNLSELASRAHDRVANKMGAGMKSAERAELRALMDETATQALSNVGDRPIEIPQGPRQVWEVKRTYDNRSSPTYQKMDRGQPVPVSAIEQQYNKALADEARDWLRVNVPNLGRQMQRTSELVRLKPRMEYAESRPGPRTTLNPIKALEGSLGTREAIGRRALSARGPGDLAAVPGMTTVARNAPRAMGLTVDEVLQYLKNKRLSSETDSL